MVNFSYIEEAYSYKDNNEKPKKTKKIIQQPQPIVYNYPIDNKTKEETEKALQTSLNPPSYNNNNKIDNDEFDTYLNLGFYNTNNTNNTNNNNQKQIPEPQINKCLKDLKEMFNNKNENENKNENNIKIDINLFNLFLFIFLGIIIIILIDQITKIAIYKAT